MIFITCEMPNSPVSEPADMRAPQNLSVISADSQLTVLWDAVVNAEKYEIRLDGEPCAVTEETIKTIRDLVNDQQYVVEVRAIGNSVSSGWSRMTAAPFKAIHPPAAPQIKVLPGNRQIDVLWGPVEGALSFKVYLNNVLTTEVSGTTTAQISNLENDQEYTVQVKAANGAGESGYSNFCVASPDPLIRDSDIGRPCNYFAPPGSPDFFKTDFWLDLDPLIADGLVRIKNVSTSSIDIATEERIVETIAKFNSTTNLSIGGQFMGIGGSLSAGNDFQTSSEFHDETKYLLAKIEHRTKEIYVDMARIDKRELVQTYLKPNVLYIFDHYSYSPKKIRQRLGDVMFLTAGYGAEKTVSGTYHNTRKETMAQFRSEANGTIQHIASTTNISATLETSTVTTNSEWQTDTTFSVKSRGGALSTARNLEEALDPSWDATIYETPVYCGPSSNISITIWELAEMLGKHTLAAELQESFIADAIELAYSLEDAMPGEWLRLASEEYSTANKFTLPKMTITTEQGPKDIPVYVYVWLSGGGGGGQGEGGSKNHNFSGGGGGSSSAGFASFKTSERVEIEILVGKGGNGSPACDDIRSAYARVGYKAEDGGATIVTWNGVTLIASGGTGGGFGGGPSNVGYQPNGDSRGGTGGVAEISGLTGDIIEKFKFKYTLVNGNPGLPGGPGYVHGQGGAPVTIKSFTAAAGGRGGGGSPAIHGENGQNGRVRIQYYFYDGF